MKRKPFNILEQLEEVGKKYPGIYLRQEFDVGHQLLVYSLDGKPHRENGPAIQTLDSTGKVLLESFYLDGVPYREEEWREKVFLLHLQKILKE